MAVIPGVPDAPDAVQRASAEAMRTPEGNPEQLAQGQYRVKIPHSVHQAIRHLPFIVDHCTQIAMKGAEIGGPGWTVIVQNDPQTRRPRAYIVCTDPDALARDAKDSTLMHILSGLRGQ